ncbi:MAG TPA: tryptophan-rich sensory protein, partial [Candidatus Pacearchaeota archaeon]|nr:tryptophan-rich sensory protein [Candidatus Pacearchaeota archaeon]
MKIKYKKKNKRKYNRIVFLFCFMAVFLLLGGIGSLFTAKNTDTLWYYTIKPSITPPNWVFPVVWNILFILITFSLYYAWIETKNKKQKKLVGLLFGINFILNILWSILFFELKFTQIAFFEIILLWFSILAIIVGVNKISKKSSWLLLPYLIWVAFASILNILVAF